MSEESPVANAGPLSGVRVIDMTTVVVGPICTRMLADQGADVIKVEAPRGDLLRTMAHGSRTPGMSGKFINFNRNKRSVCIDVKTESGRDVIGRLVDGADVFVSNYRAPALERMGLDIATMGERYPKLIIGHVNGFGPRGPDADKAMLDGAAQARGGIASLSGHRGQTPTPPGAA